MSLINANHGKEYVIEKWKFCLSIVLFNALCTSSFVMLKVVTYSMLNICRCNEMRRLIFSEQ